MTSLVYINSPISYNEGCLGKIVLGRDHEGLSICGETYTLLIHKTVKQQQ